MRAKHCTCTTPPHRYLEDDSGQMWMETISSDPPVWRKTNMGYDDAMDSPTIDPEPVWAEIVAAQLKGEVDGL